MTQLRLTLVSASMALLLSWPGLAAESLDISAYAAAETIEVLTSDEDGETRETTIWIVIVDGAAYIRTGGTAWGENLQRTPHVKVRLEGSTQTFDVLFVEEDDVRSAANDAFREKYGFQDKVVSFFRGSSPALIMRLAEPSAPEAAS